MNIAYSLDELASARLKNTAVTIGVFDGVHKGHVKIMQEMIRFREMGWADSAYLITFYPHPLTVTHSRIAPPILSTIEERIELLKEFPLDGIFVIKFDSEIANLTYKTFFDRYLVNALKMKHLVIGYDFHFGKNREGSPQRLLEDSKKGGFGLKIVNPVRLDDIIISSTQIRNQIIEGNVTRALSLLGHPYLVRGTVVEGHGMGRGIGFPTANISIANPYKLWPSKGVYAVNVKAGQEMHLGMMNVGSSPTMKNLTEGTREIEVHLFDFDGDLYNETLSVYCCEYMRPEMPFPNSGALVAQLERDKTNAHKILRSKRWDSRR
jgi:riboflavin kinase/FMN adenylyltransferase